MSTHNKKVKVGDVYTIPMPKYIGSHLPRKKKKALRKAYIPETFRVALIVKRPYPNGL